MNRFGNLLNFDKGHGLSQASKYHGGEERANSSGNLTCVAIAGESAASGDRKEAVAALLLKNILGSGSRVKYGGASGKLAKAVEKIEGQKAVSGLNCSYADSGLTGAFIVCESSIAGKVSKEKNQDISVTQILREISFGGCRSSKNAIYPIFRPQNF